MSLYHDDDFEDEFPVVAVPDYEPPPLSDEAQLSLFLEKLKTEEWPKKDKYLKTKLEKEGITGFSQINEDYKIDGINNLPWTFKRQLKQKLKEFKAQGRSLQEELELEAMPRQEGLEELGGARRIRVRGAVSARRQRSRLCSSN